MRSSGIWLALFGVAACLSPTGGGAPAGSTSGSTGAEVATGATSSTSSTNSPGSSGGSTSPGVTTGGEDGTEDTGLLFIPWPDGGGPDECDVYAQTCPEGQKCAWNSLSGPPSAFAVCVPLARDPLPDGAPCSYEPWSFDGTDECGLWSVCTQLFFSSDEPDDDMGTCKALCRGSAAHPYCEGHAVCIGGRTDWLCEPMCDPFVEDCPDGRRCDLYGPAPLCSTEDLPDEPKLALGAACNWTGQCELGFVCWPGATADCAANCCTPFCDRSDPQVTCPSPGQACLTPFDGYVQPGAENVGVCRMEAP